MGLYVRWHTDRPHGALYNEYPCAVNGLLHAIRFVNFFIPHERGHLMNSIIYIVGLVVVVIAVLSFFGMR